jgi:lysine-specific metallo-endopeptidase family protein
MHFIDQSDLHAQIMLDNAINVLASYFPDTGRPEVKEALRTTMGSDDANRAQVAQDILQNLKDGVSEGDYQYECEAEQDADDQTLAYTIWCVPFTDIHVNPLWFSEQDINSRGETLIHEWLHWFSCKFDLGYNVENPGGMKARWNADSPANLVLALYKLK